MNTELKAATAGLIAAKANLRNAHAAYNAHLPVLAETEELARDAHTKLDIALVSAKTVANAADRADRIRHAEIIADAHDTDVDCMQAKIDRLAADIAAADIAVSVAADAVIRAEGKVKAATFKRLLPLWKQICQEVLLYIPDEMHTPINELGTPRDLGTIAGRVLSAVRDEMNIPRNQLQLESPEDFRRRRRAELAADTDDTRTEAA